MGDDKEVQMVRFNYKMNGWYTVKNTEMNRKIWLTGFFTFQSLRFYKDWLKVLILVFDCTPQACINWHAPFSGVFIIALNRTHPKRSQKSRCVRMHFIALVALFFVNTCKFAHENQSIDACMALSSRKYSYV